MDTDEVRLQFDKKMKLSRNFALEEFIVSRDHPETIRHVILAEDQILKFYYLSLWFLQPIRDMFGPLVITSAYRNFSLNDVLGGAVDSQHMYCEAVDFVPTDANAEDVMRFATDVLRWAGEVIWYPEQNRLHAALPHLDIETEYLVYRNGKYDTFST